MHLRALDTLHISALGSGNLSAGDTFELNDHDARILITRGLAVGIDAVTASAEPAPKVKKVALDAVDTQDTPALPDEAEPAEPIELAPIANKGGVRSLKKAE